MLLPVDMKPEYSTYYYGAMIIEEVKNQKKINIVELYTVLKDKIKISILSYSITLDWLYMIESVLVDEKGSVKLCI